MAKLIQATLTSDSNWVTINGEPHLRGTFVRFDPVSFDGDLGVEVSFSSLNKLHISIDGTTVNGSTVSTQQELIDWFKANSFKIGGGTGVGVQSVTAGDGINVDNTDPYNPIISATGKSNNVLTIIGESGATLTYGLTHAGMDKIVRTTGGGAKTHTVPPQASVDWPDGSVINLATPSSNVTIAAGSGVNIIAPVESPWVIEPNTLATLTRLGSNEWVLAARFAE